MVAFVLFLVVFCSSFVFSHFIIRNGDQIMSEVNEKLDCETKSTLQLKNITVLGKRTSIRLEPEMWRELKNIAYRERCTIHDLCSLISVRKNAKTSLTAAIRVFLMLYFRAAATEDGHNKAGHGSFEFMKRRAGMDDGWSALKFKKALEQNDMEERLQPYLSEKEERSLQQM